MKSQRSRKMQDLLKAIAIAPEATLRAAMEAIERGTGEIALVLDGEGRLLGTVTDGDLRRAILAGGRLEDPVGPIMKTDFTFVAPRATRNEVLDLMRARSLRQIPILDEASRLKGLHTLNEILGIRRRPNWAVIMAGGRGERLRPLTDSLPKPLIPVAGRPILERIVLHLVGFGVRRIFLSINYLGHLIEERFGDGSALGCDIQYLREDRPLGTGGSLTLLPEEPAAPLLVLNGDLLTQFDVQDMLYFHRNSGCPLTVGIDEYVHTVPFGVVDTEKDRIIDVREKPMHSWQANTGIYVLDPHLPARIPRGEPFYMPALVEDCLQRGEGVAAFRIEGEWTDVGRPTELRKARGEWEET